MKYYAGIGSRETPPDVLEFMTKVAKVLDEFGFTLRSGGAIGADQAFEKGAQKKDILYWKDSNAESERIASTVHPAWQYVANEYSKALHGRNVMQILGKDLQSPVEFVVCWTFNAKLVGGTRTAIVLAQKHSIPIYNLADPAQMLALKNNFFLK